MERKWKTESKRLCIRSLYGFHARLFSGWIFQTPFLFHFSAAGLLWLLLAGLEALPSDAGTHQRCVFSV